MACSTEHTSHPLWDAIEAAYRERFGELDRVIEVSRDDTSLEPLDEDALDDDDDAPAPGSETVAYVLVFRAREGQSTARIYATLGAAAFTRDREFFVRAAAPQAGLVSILTWLIGQPRPRLPFMRCSLLDPFVALTFLPIESASFELSVPTGARAITALQVVPVTADEVVLAGRDHGALVRRLTRAGVIHGMEPSRRSSLVRRERTWWTAQRRGDVERLLTSLELSRRRHQRLLALEAPEFVIANELHLSSDRLDALRFFGERGEAMPSEYQLATGRLGALENLIDELLRSLDRSEPAWLADEARLVLRLVFGTHPRTLEDAELLFGLPAIEGVESSDARRACLFERMRLTLLVPAAARSRDAVTNAIAQGLAAVARQGSRRSHTVDPSEMWLAVSKRIFSLLPYEHEPDAASKSATRIAALSAAAHALASADWSAAPKRRLLSIGELVIVEMARCARRTGPGLRHTRQLPTQSPTASDQPPP